MKKAVLVSAALLIILGWVAYTSLMIFIIPPIGAVPEGKTVIALRLENTNFIDSPDAICERLQGGVNLLCRGMVLAKVANNTKILLRLPYSETLYLISTNGNHY